MNVILLEQEGVAAGEARPDSLARRLAAAGCDLAARIGDTKALEQILVSDASAGSRRKAEIVVVDLVHPDRDLVERVGGLGVEYGIPVAIFVERTDPEAIRVALRAGVSSYVVRGSEASRLRDALEVARARFDEERALREALASVRSSLADRKLIERAKGRLMEIEGLDEQTAYDFLRRMAMRRNCRVIEVARALLEGPDGTPRSRGA